MKFVSSVVPIHSLTLRALCLLLVACQDSANSPPSRSDPPADSTSGGSTLGAIDLVYVCGNKFLATNANPFSVTVTYRVLGTTEAGSLPLRPGPGGDPGHSETELVTTETGVVELYHEEERVAARANGGLPCLAPPNPDPVQDSAGVRVGRWSSVVPWPIVAVHLNLLPDGSVLSWGFGGQPHLWDPESGAFTVVPEPVELFCGGHSLLSDGRLLVTGGHITDNHGLPDITIFETASRSWSRSTPMRRGRWYPTNTTIASGAVVILAGQDEDGLDVPDPEVWENGAVRVLTGARLEMPYYPRTFLAPNGRVFYAGEMPVTRYLDPSGNGRWEHVGRRLYGKRDYGAAVMYDEGRILYVGGGRTTNSAEIIDLTQPAPRWQWTGSMAVPRRHHNATVLPSGDVLVTGGTSGPGFNDLDQPALAAELWSPSTGTWTTLASSAVPRGYHGTSILLPDARVLHTGSGSRTAPEELNAEFYSPPYLFKGARPTIGDAPPAVGYGSSFTVATPDSEAISSVSLVRLGSTTHAFDMNQRFQRLTFSAQGGALLVSAPADPNRAPPGHYMLFLLNGDGVPSIARIIRIS